MTDLLAYAVLISTGMNGFVSAIRGDWRFVWMPRRGAWLWLSSVLISVSIGSAVLATLGVVVSGVWMPLMIGPVVLWQLVTVGAKLWRVDRPDEEPLVEGG
ncbi:MAG: hypothetical protein JJU33_09665 [Phycisphaerales bacterium]|nr:hypothetical protein [Phycisphaerales bacterium]